MEQNSIDINVKTENLIKMQYKMNHSSAIFTYTTNTGQVTLLRFRSMRFMHANKSSDFASMVDFGENDTTCSSKSETCYRAGLGLASIMDFGLNWKIGRQSCILCMEKKSII